jgi:hypothetical protein
MLMPLETNDPHATVALRWVPSLAEQAALGISSLGLLLLVALAVDGLFLHGNGFTWMKIALVMRIPQPFLGEGSNREWRAKRRVEAAAVARHRALILPSHFLVERETHREPPRAAMWPQWFSWADSASRPADAHRRRSGAARAITVRWRLQAGFDQPGAAEG